MSKATILHLSAEQTETLAECIKRALYVTDFLEEQYVEELRQIQTLIEENRQQ